MGRTGRVYRRIRANFTDKPSFFTWVREGRLAASGRPYSREQVVWLRDHGVTTILSLTEDPLPADWTRGLETRHLPMNDHAPPKPSEMRLGADYLAAAIKGGKVVLVHCLAGKGRTGSVLAAYLMVHERKTAREALKELRSKRRGSVEWAQEPSVLEFEAEAVKGRSAGPARGTTHRSFP